MMPWIKKIKYEHACRLPTRSVSKLKDGSVWECKRCHRYWELAGKFTDFAGYNENQFVLLPKAGEKPIVAFSRRY